MMPQYFYKILADRAFDGIRLHEADRAQWQTHPMLQDSALEEIQFQAATSQIEDQPWLRPVAQPPVNPLANQARFLFAADYFEFQAGLSANALHEPPIVAGFARRRRGHRAVTRDVMLVHAVPKVTEDAPRARNRIGVQHSMGKGIVAQGDGRTFV